MSKKKKTEKPKKVLIIPHSSKVTCLCDFSDRYWDKNRSKCLKCGKIFSN